MSEYENEVVNEVPEESEQLDQDQLQPDTNLDDRGVEDALDEGYSPPENYSALVREGAHETLDERLEEEVPEPDPYAEPEDIGAGVAPEDDFVGPEVGDERAGRLVDPDQGLGPDEEGGLVGDDVGIDAGAASAEEAAVHVVVDEER